MVTRPYSGISKNNSKWITNLIEDYKYIDGKHFRERKHWLGDDYVKFIRLAQFLIEKNGEGVFAYVNNHAFLDNPTFRGMRWNLLNSFDDIYIIDLHGSTLREEVCPDGSVDEPVFDIQPGVSINFFIKKKKKSNGLAKVKHLDVWGKKDKKYKYLFDSNMETCNFQELEPKKPYYFFTPKVMSEDGYDLWHAINEIFPVNKTGMLTMGDNFIVAKTKKELEGRIKDFIEKEYTEKVLKEKYKLGKNYAGWILENKEYIKNNPLNYIEYDYRPFDKKVDYF